MNSLKEYWKDQDWIEKTLHIILVVSLTAILIGVIGKIIQLM